MAKMNKEQTLNRKAQRQIQSVLIALDRDDPDAVSDAKLNRAALRELDAVRNF